MKIQKKILIAINFLLIVTVTLTQPWEIGTARDMNWMQNLFDLTVFVLPLLAQRRRRKVKSLDKVETVKASFLSAAALCNGGAKCNGAPAVQHPPLVAHRLMPPAFRDSPSEGSSEGSSHSDEPPFCGITTACTRMCDGLPPAKTRAEKRASRRRRLKPGGYMGAELLQPHRDSEAAPPISTILDLVRARAETSARTPGPNGGIPAPL